MRRLFLIFLGFLLLFSIGSQARAASPKAMALRQANGLTVFSPPESFLSGNFVAEEMNPAFIFGPVKTFVSSRTCPTTWLIEEGVKKNLPKPGTSNQPAEYTLYLEEDCPDQVIYYVFIDQSGMTPQQWIDYRYKFHGKTKTEPEYGPTKSKLEQACTELCGVGAELRFIQQNGELLNQSPEAYLRQNLKFAPIYDLNKQKKISK
jgi:hypothetical protein